MNKKKKKNMRNPHNLILLYKTSHIEYVPAFHRIITTHLYENSLNILSINLLRFKYIYKPE